MPVPDLGVRRSSLDRLRLAQERALARLIDARIRGGGARRPGRRPDGQAGEVVPVTPDRPLDLSGGAAAALFFED